METDQMSSQLSAVRSELGVISQDTLTELRRLVITGLGASDDLGRAVEQCERSDLSTAKAKISQLETDLVRQEEQFNKVVKKSQSSIEKAAAAGALNAANRVQDAAKNVQDAISDYKDVIANGIEKVRKAVVDAVGPVIEKLRTFVENLIKRLKDLWERAKQSLGELQKQIERIFGDMLVCLQTLISEGMTAFQQGKQAFEAAKAAGQAVASKEWEKAKQKATEAKTAGEAAYKAGEKCYEAVKKLVKELPIDADALLSSIKTHVKAAQDAAAEALDATKSDALAVCDQAKRSAVQLRSTVESEMSLFEKRSKQTAERLRTILVNAVTDIERQAIQDAQNLLQELELSGQELLGVLQKSVQKLGSAAHDSGVSGKKKEDVEPQVQESITHQEDAQGKIKKVQEIEGKLWSCNWNGLGGIGQELQQVAADLVRAGRQVADQVSSLAGDVKQAIAEFNEEAGAALRQRVEQWKGVASAAESTYQELKSSLEKQLTELKQEAEKTIRDAESGLEQLKSSFDQFVEAGSQAIDKLKKLDLKGAMTLINKGKDLYEKGKSFYEQMKSHYEKLKQQVLALKDSVEHFIHQADGVIKQAAQAAEDTVTTAKHVGDTLREKSQKLMESAGQKLDQAKKSMTEAQRSVGSVAGIARHAGDAVKQGCEAAGKSVTALATAGTAALQSGFGVKEAAMAAAGTVEEDVRKGVLKLCETAQKAVDGAKNAAKQAAEAAQQVASGNAGGAMASAQSAEQQAISARGDSQEAQDQGNRVSADAKQAHAANTDPTAFRQREAERAKSQGAGSPGVSAGGTSATTSGAQFGGAAGSSSTDTKKMAEADDAAGTGLPADGNVTATIAKETAASVSKDTPSDGRGGVPVATERASSVAKDENSTVPGIASAPQSQVQSSQGKGLFEQLKDLAGGDSTPRPKGGTAADDGAAKLDTQKAKQSVAPDGKGLLGQVKDVLDGKAAPDRSA